MSTRLHSPVEHGRLYLYLYLVKDWVLYRQKLELEWHSVETLHVLHFSLDATQSHQVFLGILSVLIPSTSHVMSKPFQPILLYHQTDWL